MPTAPEPPDPSSPPIPGAPWRPDERGLVCAVVQEHGSGEVLMVAWMDAEAVRRTVATGRATYWSRSRSEYWVKGETSGHSQHVRSLSFDCDGDALLLTVDQEGPACHTGNESCFDALRLDVPVAEDRSPT